MVKKLFRTHGRHRPDELITALLALSPLELVQNLVKLFARESFASAEGGVAKPPERCAPDFYRYHENNPQIADWFLTAARSSAKEQHRDRYQSARLPSTSVGTSDRRIIKTDGGFQSPITFAPCTPVLS